MTIINNYNTSKDYELLWELAKTQKIIAVYSWSSETRACIIDNEFISRKTKNKFIECCSNENLEFILPNAWISVKDRLPKLHKTVLTYSTSDGIGISCLTIYGWSWTSSVTHWQPLPEPPKGE